MRAVLSLLALLSTTRGLTCYMYDPVTHDVVATVTHGTIGWAPHCPGHSEAWGSLEAVVLGGEMVGVARLNTSISVAGQMCWEGREIAPCGGQSRASRKRAAQPLTHVYQSNPAVVGNHNPTFVLKGVDVVVHEDSGAYLDGDQYVLKIDDGNGFTQNVRFKVTNDNNRLFTVQPHVIGCSLQKCQGTVGSPLRTGALHFTLAPNQFGKAQVEVVAVDDGWPRPLCDGPPLDPMGNKCTPIPCTPEPCTNSDPQYFWIEVIAVNDPPSFDHKGDVTSDEDQPVCHDMWATGITAGGWGEDFMQADPQHLIWTLTTSRTDLFRVQPFLVYHQGEPTASLCYEPAANKTGQALMTVDLMDSGHPPLSFPTQYITITIAEVNDPPSFTPGPLGVRVLEDSGEYNKPWARDIVPGPPEEIDAGQRVGHFRLEYENSALAALFSKRPEIDKDTGRLSFTPAPNANTHVQSVVLHISLEDLVRPPLVPLDTPKTSLTIDITPVNDPPSFVPAVPDGLLDAREDEPEGMSRAWAANICVGGANPECVEREAKEEGQRVVFAVEEVSVPRGMFEASPRVSEDGYVTFTLAPNKAGEALFAVTISDTGPRPGNVGPTHPLRIRVSPENDPPTFNHSSSPVFGHEDGGDHVVPRFLTAVRPGPLEPDEAKQTVTCTVAVDPAGSSMFRFPPAITKVEAELASLTFTPLPDVSGTAEAAVTCTDGELSTTGPTFDIIILPTRDPPSFRLVPFVAVDEDVSPFGVVVKGVATNITAGPGEDGEEVVYFNVTTYDTWLIAGIPAMTPQGTLSFTTVPDVNGNATLYITAIDRIRTANGSVGMASETKELRVVVRPVNDPPIITLNRSTLPLDPASGDTIPLRVEVCPEDCTKRIDNALVDVVAGPHEEALTQELNVSFVLPPNPWPLRAAWLGLPPFSFLPSRAFPKAHANGTSLVLSMAGVAPDTVLPSVFALRLIARDNTTNASSVAILPILLLHPVAAGGAAVRFAVAQQPVVGRGVVTPPIFQLQNAYGEPAPSAASVEIMLHDIDRALEYKHHAVRALPSTPQSTFTSHTLELSPGVYFLSATALLPSGTRLTARTVSFTVPGVVLSASPRLLALSPAGAVDIITEHLIRMGSIAIDFPAPSNTSWAPNATVVCSVSHGREAAPLGATDMEWETAVTPTLLTVTFPPRSAFNIDANSTLEVTVSKGALVGGIPVSRTVAFPLRASPSVEVIPANATIPSGGKVLLVLRGGLWRGTASIASAFRPAATAAAGMVGNNTVEVVLTAPPGVYQLTSEGLSVTTGLPEVSGGFVTIQREDPPAPPSPPASEGWGVLAVALAVCATIVAVLGNGHIFAATAPPIAAVVAQHGEGLGGAAERVADWVAWTVTGGLLWVAVLAAVLVAHLAVVAGFRFHLGDFRSATAHSRFPSLSIGAVGYLAVGFAYAAATVGTAAEIVPAVAVGIALLAVHIAVVQWLPSLAEPFPLASHGLWRPHSFWTSLNGGLERWGFVFWAMTDRRLWWRPVEAVLMCLVIPAVHEVPALILLALHGIGTAILRPHISLADTYLTISQDVIRCVALATVAYPSEGGWRSGIVGGLVLLSLATSLLHGLLLLAIRYIASRPPKTLDKKWWSPSGGHPPPNPIPSTFSPTLKTDPSEISIPPLVVEQAVTCCCGCHPPDEAQYCPSCGGRVAPVSRLDAGSEPSSAPISSRY